MVEQLDQIKYLLRYERGYEIKAIRWLTTLLHKIKVPEHVRQMNK